MMNLYAYVLLMLTHSAWWVLMEPTLMDKPMCWHHIYIEHFWRLVPIVIRLKVKCEVSWQPFWHKGICFQTKKGNPNVFFIECCEVVEMAINHVDLMKVVIIYKNI